MLNAILSFGLMALLAASAFLVGYDLSKRSETVQIAQEELAFRETAGQSLATLKEDNEKAKPLFEKLGRFLPPFQELEKFPEELQAFAKKNAVSLAKISFGEVIAAVNDKPGVLIFNFEVSGSYANFLKFIGDLNGNYRIALDSIDLSRQGQTQNRFTAPVSGILFFK